MAIPIGSIQTGRRFEMQPLKAKTVTKNPPRGPRTRGVLPRYVAIGNHKKVAYTKELWPGQVFGDFNDDGELIGVEIH